jgi:hypothetical protein
LSAIPFAPFPLLSAQQILLLSFKVNPFIYAVSIPDFQSPHHKILLNSF